MINNCYRYVDNIELVKQYVYDLIFFKSPRNHLLIGIIIGKSRILTLFLYQVFSSSVA